MKFPARLAAPGLSGHAAALAAGALLPLAFAPFDLWPVAILAPALLLRLLQGLPAAAVMLRAWSFGLGMFGTGTSWVYVSIHDFGAAPLPLAAFLTLLFSAGLALLPAVTFWIWARWVRGAPAGGTLGFALMWLVGEWWRGWMLTGFPWLYLGYSQVDGPLRGWAPLVGEQGIGLLLAFTAVTLVAAPWRSRPGRIRLAACAALWALSWPLARVEWVTPGQRTLSVAMVQGNIPQQLKWEPGHLGRTLDTYARMTEPLWGTELVVWPEAAIPTYLDHARDYLGAMAARAAASGSTLITGIPSREADPRAVDGEKVYNSVVALGTDSGIYHKRRLVPFGEYVPLESWLRGLIGFFDLPMSNFSRGPQSQPALSVHGLSVTPFICYEIVYAGLVAESLPEADVLLTVSNDTWFGASIGPLQHLQMARMRALEAGRPLIRATNNGVSALVDHRGAILVRGAQFSREVIRGQIRPVSGSTPFARTGQMPLLLLSLLTLAAMAARRVPHSGQQ